MAVLSVLAGLLMSQSAHAASATWSNTSSGSWTTGTNWTPAAAPGATTGTTNADIATFNGYGNPIITVPTGENFGGITFATTGTTANGFILSGGSLLPSNNATIQSDSTFRGIAQVATGITAQGDLNLTANGLAGSGMLFNTITTSGTLGNVTLTLSGSNSGYSNILNNQIVGGISQGASSTVALVKTGAGTWVLGGSNSYTGGITLNGGTLITGNATALGLSGTITVQSNTTLRTVAALTDPSSRITINDGATLTFDTFNNTQTWTGVLGNSGGSNTAGLTKTGLGNLVILPAAGAAQTWKGTTTVNMGTLTISGTSQTAGFSNLINSSSALVLGGGNINFTGKVGFANSQTFNGTTLNAGISGFIPAASTGTNTFDFGTLTRNNGALLDIQNAGNYTIKAGATSNDAGGLVKGVLYAGDFATSNSGTLAAVTYTGTNDASAWTSPTANYSTSGPLTTTTVGAGGLTTINSLKLNGTGSQSFSISGTMALNDGLLFGSSIGANASEVSQGSLTSGSGDLIIVNNNAQNTYGRNTVSSAIVDNANGATNVIFHSRAQNGTLYISGSNTYTGNTYIGGGVNAQTGNMVTLVGGTAGARIGSSGATVYVNGGTGGTTNVLRVGNGDNTGDVLGTIQLDNGRLSLNRTDTFVLSGTVTSQAGGGYISQDGAGTATVNLASGNNFFAGIRTSAAGTLTLAGVGSVNTFGLMDYSQFNASSTVNFSSGTYYLNGPGNNGNNQLGTIAVNGASVYFSGGRYWLSKGGTLTLNSGYISFNGDRLNGTDYANVTPTIFNIYGGVFDVAAGSTWTLSGQAAATFATTANQTGGEVQVGVMANSTSAGTTSALTIGQSGTNNHASSYNLSGGVLRMPGTISSAGAITSGTGSNNFNWTGGRLTVGTINMTNLISNDGVNSGTGTLFQGGTSSVMSPGDTFQGNTYAGKTAITGNYRIDAGSVSIGIGGTTAASVFHDLASKYDNIAVSGSATLGGTLAVSFNNAFTPLAANSFTILTAGTISGSFSNLTGGGRVNVTGGSMLVTVGATTVVLSNYGAGSLLTWVGGLNGDAWDVATTSNFNNGAGSSQFNNGDFVTFDDTTANRTVNLNTTVSPGSVTVNTAGTYIIQGSGSISGAGATFNKSGTGTLVLSTSNGYTGATTVSNGTLTLGNANALGTGSLTVSAPGKLDLNGNSLGLSSIFNDTGTFLNSGTSTSVVTASPATNGTFSGSMTNSGGGAVNLVHNGPGTMTLIGNIDGNVTVNGTNAGALTVNAVGKVGGSVYVAISGGNGIANLVSSGTIGSLQLQAPAGGNPVYKFGGNNAAGYAKLNAGSTTGNILADGRLDIMGGLNAIGTISSTLSGSGTANAIGYIGYYSTTGNTLTFQNGSSYSQFLYGADSINATLQQTGAGSGVNFDLFGYSTSTPNANVTLNGGTWTFGLIGQNNSGAQTSGSTTITNGAAVTVLGNTGFSHGTWIINNASMTFNGGVSETNGNSTPGNTSLKLRVSGTGALTISGGLTLADGGSGTNSNELSVSGGTATMTSLTIGSTTSGHNDTNAVNLSGGSLVVNGAISAPVATTTGSSYLQTTAGSTTATIQNFQRADFAPGLVITGNPNITDGTTISSIVGTTITLSATAVGTSGTSYIATTFTGGSQSDQINWTGGRLVATSINATNIRASGDPSPGTLKQNGATALLDVTGNNTSITGTYALMSGTAQIGGGRTLTVTGALTGSGVVSGATSGTGTLIVSSTTTNSTFAGQLIDGTGILALQKSGSGTTLFVTGSNNSYSGLTHVTNGTLEYDASQTLTGGLKIDSPGTVVLGAHSGGASNVRVLDISSLTISGTTPFVGGGKDISLADGGLGAPVTPVPEPGTWVMLLSGLGLLGALRRVSRRKE